MTSLCEEYILSHSVEEALHSLCVAKGSARILSGGSDLLLELQQGIHPPVRVLVDVTEIEEMCVDVGKCLNPLGLQGQAEGGVMMGIGSALMENFIVDEGVVFTDRMARYRIPTKQHTPEIVSFVVEHPTQEGPYGAKRVGEIAGIPTAPAITNAIYNAVGVRVDHLLADHEFIWKELNNKLNNNENT